MAVKLPPKNDDEGAETRLLLAECLSPSFRSYTLADAITCMQLMDRVLWNRFNDPDKWRKGAKSIADIIRVKGQFAGFENYPNYDVGIANNIQAIVDIANSSKDKRSPAFTDHVNAAIKIATDPSISDPSPGTLAFWRTAGHGSPGAGATLQTTVLGNSFYFVS